MIGALTRKKLMLIGALNEYADTFYRNINDTSDDDENTLLHDYDLYKP